jgi:hypothetical protein
LKPPPLNKTKMSSFAKILVQGLSNFTFAKLTVVKSDFCQTLSPFKKDFTEFCHFLILANIFLGVGMPRGCVGVFLGKEGGIQHVLWIGQLNSTFFAFSLIIEVTTEKVLKFKMPLKSIYNQNLGFIEQKNVFLNTTERFKQEKYIN